MSTGRCVILPAVEHGFWRTILNVKNFYTQVNGNDLVVLVMGSIRTNPIGAENYGGLVQKGEYQEKLDDLRSPNFFGIQLRQSKKVKYLSLILQYWNSYMQKIPNKKNEL